jgi:hypothetical protein
MIQCSECGRSISDQAPACVACGAPISAAAPTGFTLEPQRSTSPPLTRSQLRWRLGLASLTFFAGLLAAARIEHHQANRTPATLAALLLIGGFCWLIVAVIQNAMARK